MAACICSAKFVTSSRYGNESSFCVLAPKRLILQANTKQFLAEFPRGAGSIVAVRLCHFKDTWLQRMLVLLPSLVVMTLMSPLISLISSRDHSKFDVKGRAFGCNCRSDKRGQGEEQREREAPSRMEWWPQCMICMTIFLSRYNAGLLGWKCW